MARKGNRLPESADEFADKNTAKTAEEKSEIARLAALARKQNEAKAKAEARKSNVPDEVYLRNWDSISEVILEMDIVEKELKRLKGVMESRYKTAKADGCDIDAMKRLRKDQKQDIDAYDHEMRTVARIARIVGSPVAETSLMKLLEETDKVNPYTQGFTAGKAGDDVASNPHQPGSVEFQKWSEGHGAGTKKLHDEFVRQSNDKNKKPGGKLH